MIEAFLAEAASTDHVWSQWDCAMTIANWWHRRYGIDPAADLRGTYHTEGDCVAVVEHHGGMVNLVGERARRAGALETRTVIPGDIGVVEIQGFRFGAILGPTRRWHVKSLHGVAGFRCDFIKAWSV